MSDDMETKIWKPRATRAIKVGTTAIGGGAPVAVQTMTKTDTRDAAATIAQARRLELLGCDIIRLAIPDPASAATIAELKKHVTMPIVADIHFSSELAMQAIDAGADCVRVNPGNIGGFKALRSVALYAGQMGCALRIGINAGSLEKTDAAHGGSLAHRMAAAALRWCDVAATEHLSDVKVSMKAFDVDQTVAACREFASLSDVPQHIGITESGDEFSGSIRSAAAMGILLDEGIGDTIRFSLAASPEREVEAAWALLTALGIRRRGAELVICPTCGRCGDARTLFEIADSIKSNAAIMARPIRIAIMGCEVNGPGEAASADFGVALMGHHRAMLFAKGVRAGDCPIGEAAAALAALVAG